MPSEKLVKDFMRPLDEYHYLGEEGSVGEALALMGKAADEGKPPCLVVVAENLSEKEVIKGFVTPKELVFGLTGHFLKGAQKSGPIFWEGQFEAECLEGVKKRIDELMVPIMGCVRETEMLMEAVYLLNKYHVNFLPVVDQDDVVGIIHLEDIMREISRIVFKQVSG